MKTIRGVVAIVATGAALFVATPRSEAGSFSFSIFFPFPCEPQPPACPKPAPPPCKTWVPGHYEKHTETVWVPATYETVWVPPVYGYVRRGCETVRVLRTPGHYETIQHPGHQECREVCVWVPGHYEYVNRSDDNSNHDKVSPIYF